MYCPRCRRDVPATEHEYSDRIMYVCSKCGFVIKVVHKSRRLYFPDRTPYPSPFISLGALFILILFCIAPVFSISISPNFPAEGYINDIITFNITVTQLNGTGTYTFDFGDGTKQSGTISTIGTYTFYHVYASLGNFTLNFTASDNDSPATITQTIFIKKKILPPKCSISYTKLSTENEYKFEASCDKPIISYTWKIDGATRYGNPITYTFRGVGTYEIELEAKDRDNKINITSITLEIEEEEASEGTLMFIPTFFSRSYQQDVRKTETFLLINNLDRKVYIMDIRTGGTTTTTFGEQPISLGDVSAGELPPGGQLAIPVTVDTRGLSTDIYPCTLTVYARDMSNNYYQATINVVINVVKKAVPQENISSFNIQYPKKAKLNKPFFINVTGLLSNDDIYAYLGENIVVLGDYPKREGNNWYLRVKCTAEGIQNVEIDVKRKGVVNRYNLEINCTKEVTKKITIAISPIEPLPGDMVTITTSPDVVPKVQEYDENNNLIREIYTKSFRAVAGHTYKIYAEKEGYLSNSLAISVSRLPLRISVNPPNPEPGDEITVTLMTGSEEATDAILYINNQSTGTYKKTFKVEKGTYRFEGKGDKYRTTTYTLTVKEKAITILNTSNVSVGSPVIIKLSDTTFWNVTYQGELVAQGDSDTIKFTPNQPGIYTVYVEGLGSFNVEVPQMATIHIPANYLLVAVLILAVVLVPLYYTGHLNILVEKVREKIQKKGKKPKITTKRKEESALIPFS